MARRNVSMADLATDDFRLEEEDEILLKADKDEDADEEEEGADGGDDDGGDDEDRAKSAVDTISADDLSKSLDNLVAAARGDALRKGKKKKDPMAALAGYLKEDLDAEDLQRVKGIVGDLSDGVGAGSHATVDKTGKGGEQSSYPAGGQFKGAAKSEFEDDPDIAKAIDVSPYLDALVERTTGALDRVAGRVEKGFGQQEDFNEELAKGLRGLGRLITSQQEQIDSLNKALDAPVGRKAVMRASDIRKSERGFARAGAGDEDGEQLTKSQILDRLVGEYEKLYKSDGPTSADAERLLQGVAKYEATGHISREHAMLVGLRVN